MSTHLPQKSQRKKGTVSLERALSKLGLASRTQAREWILAGRVWVDGRVVRDPLRAVVPEKIALQIDGEAPEQAEWRMILFHKPRGVVTTRKDEQGRKTVYDVLGANEAKLMPVGRLDLATSGLLLLTNDNRLASYLTDPQSQIIRSYLVSVKGELLDEEAETMMSGVRDENELLKAHRVLVRKRSRVETHLVVELDEGKNREIRRLCKLVGHEVTKLKRVSFGGLTLGDLSLGSFREVTQEEIATHFPRAPTHGPLR